MIFNVLGQNTRWHPAVVWWDRFSDKGDVLSLEELDTAGAISSEGTAEAGEVPSKLACCFS